MERGSLYGEPVSDLRIQAALANHVLKLTSATFNDAGGDSRRQAAYDFNAESFQLNTRTERHRHRPHRLVRSHNFDATGKVAFTVTGSGTSDDPLAICIWTATPR